VPTPAPVAELPRIYCVYCRVTHLPLPLEGCDPFAPGPEPQPEPPVDPLTATIDMAVMEKEARRSRRR
jgi:hypothetical protein